MKKAYPIINFIEYVKLNISYYLKIYLENVKLNIKNFESAHRKTHEDFLNVSKSNHT